MLPERAQHDPVVSAILEFEALAAFFGGELDDDGLVVALDLAALRASDESARVVERLDAMAAHLLLRAALYDRDFADDRDCRQQDAPFTVYAYAEQLAARIKSEADAMAWMIEGIATNSAQTIHEALQRGAYPGRDTSMDFASLRAHLLTIEFLSRRPHRTYETETLVFIAPSVPDFYRGNCPPPQSRTLLSVERAERRRERRHHRAFTGKRP